MKKLFLLSLVLVLNACESVPVESSPLPVEPDEAAMEVAIPEGWVEFRDEEIGVSVWGPADETPYYDERSEGSLDEGYYEKFSITNFHSIATTSDYAIAAGEGCCFYYSGAPLDLSQTDEELEMTLEAWWPNVYHLERITIDGKEAVKFMAENGYVSYWLTPTVLIPYEENGFTNLMVTGSQLFMSSAYDSGVDIDAEIQVFIDTEYETGEVQSKLKEFETTLSTVSFFESDFYAPQGLRYETYIEQKKEEELAEDAESGKVLNDIYEHRDTLTINGFTFDIPENWYIGTALDENTYHMKLLDIDGESYYFNFALQPFPDNHYKYFGMWSPETNSAQTLEITYEHGSPRTYGIWDENDLMYWFNLQENAGAFPPYYENDILSPEVVEAVVVSVR